MTKRFVLLLGLITIALLIALVAGCQQRTATTGSTPGTAVPSERTAAQDEWAVCAYDGMVMKKQGMGATAEYQGKTLYFCSPEHRDLFMADPEKYQRTWQAFGDDVSFNVLPIQEHMQAMEDMGMHMEMPPGTTHHVTVCVMGGTPAGPVTDLTVSAKLTPPQGETTTLDMPLASDRKHYAANVDLPTPGEYQVEVALSRNGITETHSFVFPIS